MQQIREEGLIKDDIAYFQINTSPFVGKSIASEPYGKTVWDMPVNFHVFQWNELWKNLQDNIPDECYKPGVKIVHARSIEDGKVELTTKADEKWQFDLVLFAD